MGFGNTYVLNEAVTTIDFTHEKLHEGDFFSGGYYNSNIANDSSLDILIQNTTSGTHAVFLAALGGDATFKLFESPVFSNAGTSVTMSNHNRNSIKTFVGTVTHTPTISNVGTQMNGTTYMPGGTGGHAIGNTINGFSNEFILKANINYLIRLTNVSGQESKGDIRVSCYQTNI